MSRRQAKAPSAILPRDIPIAESIKTYCHCRVCVEEWRAGLAPGDSPESYARLSVGFTEIGLQVWCVRHDVNVMHVDFEGKRHPANLARDKKGDQ